MMLIFRLAAWVLLTAVVAMTVGPLGLRPQTHFSPDIERLAAYAVLGLLFALAYPRRPLRLLGMFLVAAAGVLELAQLFVPHRDAHLNDFLFKAGGAVVGLIVGRFAYLIVPLRHRRSVFGGIE
jgi:VanZ family protein